MMPYLRAARAAADALHVRVRSEPQIYFYAGLRAAPGYIYMYPLMENQPYAADIMDRGTRYVWGREAAA